MEWGRPGTPAIIMWHGLARTGRDFDWIARDLSDRFHIICPDTIGRGLSQWSPQPEKEYCLAFNGRLAVSLMDQLGVGEALVKHPQVDMISFTGSTAAGKRVGEHMQCLVRLKRRAAGVSRAASDHHQILALLRRRLPVWTRSAKICQQQRSACVRIDIEGGFSRDYGPRFWSQSGIRAHRRHCGAEWSKHAPIACAKRYGCHRFASLRFGIHPARTDHACRVMGDRQR